MLRVQPEKHLLQPGHRSRWRLARTLPESLDVWHRCAVLRQHGSSVHAADSRRSTWQGSTDCASYAEALRAPKPRPSNIASPGVEKGHRSHRLLHALFQHMRLLEQHVESNRRVQTFRRCSLRILSSKKIKFRVQLVSSEPRYALVRVLLLDTSLPVPLAVIRPVERT